MVLGFRGWLVVRLGGLLFLFRVPVQARDDGVDDVDGECSALLACG